MKVIETKLPGVFVIEPDVFGDQRGFFKETYQLERYREIGIDLSFVQDNLSRSTKGVLRGVHFQNKHPQGKLVSCPRGAVYDVAVDVDPKSSTYAQYVGLELSGDNHKQLWIPPGYAHGFCVLTDIADFFYKCTDFYYPEDESGFIWNDPEVNIKWPIQQPILSERDKNLSPLADIKSKS